ncbi:Histidinol-phosphatase [gamma proteobacterium IMCC2047]|nr:Histidinol-phosphatase [gamma proteobacterium IMCC2047]
MAEQLEIKPAGIPIVGDSVRDLVAGEALGCLPVLVRTGKGLRSLASGNVKPETLVFDDLASFVDDWLQTPNTLLT